MNVNLINAAKHQILVSWQQDSRLAISEKLDLLVENIKSETKEIFLNFYNKTIKACPLQNERLVFYKNLLKVYSFSPGISLLQQPGCLLLLAIKAITDHEIYGLFLKIAKDWAEFKKIPDFSQTDNLSEFKQIQRSSKELFAEYLINSHITNLKIQ